ncbi:MAG: hypothetical protein IPJ77_14615 [Planctomycetes bacterium]|nr:hypothetical protein [Planctomycetota bacterium]
MDALSSLERTVVWRFDAPTRAELESFRARLAADLSNPRTPPPVRPFAVVTPAGLRFAESLERALSVRGARVAEKRALSDWPRAATALYAKSFDPDRLVRAFAYEELWRNLFPRQDAELWMLDDDRALERARAWKAELRQRVRGVQVTVQGVFESFEAGLHAFHLPDPIDLEREWRATMALLGPETGASRAG